MEGKKEPATQSPPPVRCKRGLVGGREAPAQPEELCQSVFLRFNPPRFALIHTDLSGHFEPLPPRTPAVPRPHEFFSQTVWQKTRHKRHHFPHPHRVRPSSLAGAKDFAGGGFNNSDRARLRFATSLAVRPVRAARAAAFAGQPPLVPPPRATVREIARGARQPVYAPAAVRR